MSDGIKRVIESVNRTHGDERDQATRYQSFIAWQIAQRQREQGKEPSVILKK